MEGDGSTGGCWYLVAGSMVGGEVMGDDDWLWACASMHVSAGMQE